MCSLCVHTQRINVATEKVRALFILDPKINIAKGALCDIYALAWVQVVFHLGLVTQPNSEYTNPQKDFYTCR